MGEQRRSGSEGRVLVASAFLLREKAFDKPRLFPLFSGLPLSLSVMIRKPLSFLILFSPLFFSLHTPFGCKPFALLFIPAPALGLSPLRRSLPLRARLAGTLRAHVLWRNYSA